METFEDFLKEIHADLFPQLLDDDMPDHFDDWLGTLDGEDYIKWGELYGKKMHIQGSRETIADIKATMDEASAESQHDRDLEFKEESIAQERDNENPHED